MLLVDLDAGGRLQLGLILEDASLSLGVGQLAGIDTLGCQHLKLMRTLLDKE